MGRVEEFEVLMRRSECFYVTALLQAERGMYDLAVFSLEQSLQLFLKAALLREGVEFQRTHGVRRLLSILAELTGSDEIKQLQTSCSLELGILEDAYIVSRYFPRSYTGEEFERLRAAVERVRSVVGGVLAS
ncbi:MAG: HEPN domain-containing protein [Candidatus Caldarchaeales archaeon]|nr:HEPN domain-containing protein [Candidatus Caldarchaeales archaeon]